MKFFYDTFLAMPLYLWKTDFTGQIIATIILSITFISVLFILHIIFRVFDSWFLSYKEGVGKVISHFIVPTNTPIGYATTISTSIYTLALPQMTNEPNNYYLTLTINGLEGDMQVSKQLYDEISSGDDLTFLYSKNRFTNNVSFKI